MSLGSMYCEGHTLLFRRKLEHQDPPRWEVGIGLIEMNRAESYCAIYVRTSSHGILSLPLVLDPRRSPTGSMVSRDRPASLLSTGGSAYYYYASF
jgi:hypothetical protein